mgnify:CR=1 FL=1
MNDKMTSGEIAKRRVFHRKLSDYMIKRDY